MFLPVADVALARRFAMIGAAARRQCLFAASCLGRRSHGAPMRIVAFARRSSAQTSNHVCTPNVWRNSRCGAGRLLSTSSSAAGEHGGSDGDGVANNGLQAGESAEDGAEASTSDGEGRVSAGKDVPPSDGNWRGLLEDLVVEDRSITRENLRRLVADEWEHRITVADAVKEFLVDSSDLADLPHLSFENPYTGQKSRCVRACVRT